MLPLRDEEKHNNRITLHWVQAKGGKKEKGEKEEERKWGIEEARAWDLKAKSERERRWTVKKAQKQVQYKSRKGLEEVAKCAQRC